MIAVLVVVDADAEVNEVRVHDVAAMAITVHPAGDHVPGVRIPGHDVLTCLLVLVPGGGEIALLTTGLRLASHSVELGEHLRGPSSESAGS